MIPRKGMPVKHRKDFRLLPQRLDLADIMKNFTSLGLNCELGLVQRHCGAEPLGLFRFGTTPEAGLIRALESGCASIDNAARIEVFVGYGDEYHTRHLDYGFEFHTGMRQGTVSVDEVKRRTCKHFTFLSRMLMDEIAEGHKVAAFRPQEPTEALDRIGPLLRALRTRGDTVLLWMTESDDPGKAGTTQWLVRGELMIGYLAWFSATNFAAGADFESWLSVCENATKLLKSDTPHCKQA